MSGERKDDRGIRSSGRRSFDARGGRSTRRAFRPLRWAWLLLLVALLAPAYDLFLPAGYKPPRAHRTVVIERGQSLHEIARELQRVGVIRSQAGFLVLARAMHLDRSVKAGQYSFRLGTTVPALLRALDRGMYGLDLVTIPEGLMVSETAALIQRWVGIPAAAIDSLARDPMLLDSLEVGAPSLEGWLAPDSYEWLPGTSPEVVLRTMVTRTRERVQRATAGYDSLPLGMNAHEVLTLASIVESESRAKEERPHIARVYLNRLDRGMLLQADPTVGYALGRGPRSRLTFKDLRVESPYNTYRHEGLPPGPICSPGLAAIEAVMNATPDAHDLYFVARGEGRHLFAPTYEGHLANIAFVRGRTAAMAARNNPNAASRAEPDSGAAGPRLLARPGPQLANEKKPAGPASGAVKGGVALPNGTIRTAANTPPPLTVVLPGTRVPHADSAHAGSAPRTEPRAEPGTAPLKLMAPLSTGGKGSADTSRTHLLKPAGSGKVVAPVVSSKATTTGSTLTSTAPAKAAVTPAGARVTPRPAATKPPAASTDKPVGAKPALLRSTLTKPAAPDTARVVPGKSAGASTKPATKPVAKPAAKTPAKAASDTSKAAKAH